jgi:hypothetical protein
MKMNQTKRTEQHGFGAHSPQTRSGEAVMQSWRRALMYFVLCALMFASSPALMRAQTNSATAQADAQKLLKDRNGEHDFDFEFGSWKAHLRRLLHPFTGSDTWVDYEGDSIVRKVWNGRANLGELEVENRTAHIEGLSLRLYNPQSHQWSIYWSNSKDGALGAPMIGEFKNGRGEFFNQDIFQGSAIFVRFIFSDITATSFRFEQSFSSDGGKTWEPNWIATFTREKQ